MTPLLSLVAVICAATVAWVFVMARRNEGVVAAAVLSVGSFGLAVTAIFFILTSLRRYEQRRTSRAHGRERCVRRLHFWGLSCDIFLMAVANLVLSVLVRDHANRYRS